jgi:hypothetical protein
MATSDEGKVLSNQDIFPRPDPTRLTTELLNREIASVKEMVNLRLDSLAIRLDELRANISEGPPEIHRAIDALKMFIDSSLGERDKAIDLFQKSTDSIHILIDEKLLALKSLHEEKFGSIQTQFRERDVRSEQSSKDSKVAVDAALQAAKEAVGEQNKSSALAIAKSETSTTKQIDQLGSLVVSQAKNVDDKITDVKERLTRMEGQGLGKVATDYDHNASSKLNISIVSSIIALTSLIVTIIVVMRSWH